MSETKKRAVVVGGSRGLGRGAVEALVAAGYDVLALARDAATLDTLAQKVAGVQVLAGDATDDRLAGQVLAERRPDLVVVCAGAAPPTGPLQELSWEQFSLNWSADTKAAFVWLRHALRLPLEPGSHIIIVSSGAALAGSPASGGYASAKRAQWFLADYAAIESTRAGLGLQVHCVLPHLNPSTELGRAGIAVYARRAGISDEEFTKRLAPVLTPAIFGSAIAKLAAQPEEWKALAWRITGAGLQPLP